MFDLENQSVTFEEI